MKIALVAAGILSLSASVAFAGQPANPGCFGQDRAAGVQSFQTGGVNDTGAPGASEWGKIAGERGATNGEQNRAYKASCGGNPTPKAPD
jgi:hypothetical protein